MDRDATVGTWCALDRAAAIVAADRELAAGATSLRRVILDFAEAGGADDEIYDACAQLGRMVAARGGSPSFASGTMDRAAASLGVTAAPWLAGARAAVAEAFTATMLDHARHEALKSWEFPRCAVALHDQAIAIAAGLPSDDPELLSEWAARIAREAALQGVRRAIVSGSGAALAAVHDALEVVGVEATDAPASGRAPGAPASGQAGSRT
jgi:hypothetical protein